MRRMKTFNIAVCGAGVVGGGVVELIKRQRPFFHSQRIDFVVKTVGVLAANRSAAPQRPHGRSPNRPSLPCTAQLLCRDVAKRRDFEVEPGTSVTADPLAVLDDPEIDIVVEVIGGTGAPARDLVFGAAARGKHVVTANKALLADALPDVRRAFSSRRQLGFEAAVAGGVPVIRAMQESLLVDSVTGVAGIMNGTTNYCLSAMASEGKSYGDVLAAAQAAGFAEADPTADVEGFDARNKLVLLTQLAFGTWVPPARVRTTGITGVTAFDMAAAAAGGFTIKLLGVSELFDEGGGAAVGDAAAAANVAAAAPPSSNPSVDGAPPLRRRLLDIFVSPALVPVNSALGRTGGALNLVQVDSAALGRTTFAGAGAGRFPTANSIVADLFAIAKGTNAKRPFPRAPPAKVGLALKPSDAREHTFFVRGPARLADLLSVALWRQGRSVSPCGVPDATANPDKVKAFLVVASARELTSLIRRAARKVAGEDAAAAASAENDLVAQVATYQVVK